MRTKILISLSFCLQIILIYSQQGSVDLSFNQSNFFNSSPIGVVYMGAQSNGSIITFSENVVNRKVHRFDSDGNIDNSFSIFTDNNNVSYFNSAVKLQVLADDKILIATSQDLKRLNPDGTLDNSFNPVVVNLDTNFMNSNAGIIGFKVLENGKILIFGSFRTCNGVLLTSKSVILVNSDGTIDSGFNPSGSGIIDDTLSAVYAAEEFSNNKIILAGEFQQYNDEAHRGIVLINQDGTIDNSFIAGTSFDDCTNLRIAKTSDNRAIISGAFQTYKGVSTPNIIKLNLDGSIDNSLSSPFLPNSYYGFSDLRITFDNKIVLYGNSHELTEKIDGLILLESNGQRNNIFNIGEGINNLNNDYNFVVSISNILFQNDKIIICGTFQKYDISTTKYFVRLNNKEPKVFGKVFKDSNENCIQSSDENPLANIHLAINNNYVAQTNQMGYWSIDSLPTGNYTITLDTVSGNWSQTCAVPQTFQVINSNIATQAPDVGLISNNSCSNPDVSIIMPFIRRCNDNQRISVQACNGGDVTGFIPDAYTIVELDSNFTISSASIPYTDIGNNQIRFQHDTLFPGDCVYFDLFVSTSCDLIIGETACIKATLFPIDSCAHDTIPTIPTGEVTPCTLPWDHSSLMVEGWCENDSIYFTVINHGSGDMQCYTPIRIYVDGQLIILDSIMLASGDSMTYVFAGTAQTWILQADQHPLHPGNSHPNAHVENCGDGTWTPDLVNNFPVDDANPEIDIFCGPVIASCDPNDKNGFPTGINDEHFISANQDIEFMIRFQNTGTDTAFNIVVRDTLDINFDILTVETGASSNDYSFRMYGPRVLEWSFPNILLPDSTTNEPLSHGFLIFRVKQNPDLAEGTILKNNADIYFDFNEPVITNETKHTISYHINDIASVKETMAKTSNLKLYPNPSNSTITIDLSTFSKDVDYKIYSLSGKLLLEKGNAHGQKIGVDVKSLENGLYFIEIVHDNKIETLNFVKN